MNYKYVIINPKGLMIEETWTKKSPDVETGSLCRSGLPGIKTARLQHDIGTRALIEHVAVLYNDHEACMYVDENGHAKRPPVNFRASYIYHNWHYRKRLKQPCEDALASRFEWDKYTFPPEWPPIVGTAILFYKEKADATSKA